MLEGRQEVWLKFFPFPLLMNKKWKRNYKRRQEKQEYMKTFQHFSLDLAKYK